MWHIEHVVSWGRRMLGMWDVPDAGCWGCEMWDVRFQAVGCSRCGMLGMQDV